MMKGSRMYSALLVSEMAKMLKNGKMIAIAMRMNSATFKKSNRRSPTVRRILFLPYLGRGARAFMNDYLLFSFACRSEEAFAGHLLDDKVAGEQEDAVDNLLEQADGRRQVVFAL